jgi:hypothetical protein
MTRFDNNESGTYKMKTKFRKYYPSSSLGRDLIALIGAISLFLVHYTAMAQSCSASSMQYETGLADRSKMGTMCLSGDPCPASVPMYYLQYDLVAHWHEVVESGCCDGETLTTEYDSHESSTITPPDGDPANDGCPTIGIATGTISGANTVADSGCPPDDPPNTNSIIYNPITGYWVDSGGGSDCDPFYGCDYDGYGDQPGWGLETLTCDTQVQTNVNGTYTITLSSPYSTGTLEGTARGLAKSRIPTDSFNDGDATTEFTLGDEEFCASVDYSKYRIKVCGTDPQKQYVISWTVYTFKMIGTNVITSQYSTEHSGPVWGQPDVWYYPSSDGDYVKEPGWASGGCTSGDSKISYTGPISVTEVSH